MSALDDKLNYDEKLIALGHAYAEACSKVQPAWLKMLQAYPNTLERDRLRKAYTDARNEAMEARNNLLKHAAKGHAEVGT